MTKRINEYQAQEKEYTGNLVIGQTTPSHDLETPISEAKDISSISDVAIIEATKKFTGTIQQIPPFHSAIKVDGKRAYALARQGKEPELKPRQVTVSEFEITAINLPVVSFRIICSKGTYIRSLVRDVGNELGVGAYLSKLCRTRIGQFHLKDALTIEVINP